jgi:hypothetical protein
MLELSGQKEGQSTLAAELLTGDLELQANLVCYRFSSIFFLLHSSFTLLSFTMGYFSPQIFIPIVHDLHWFLIVISREKTIYILDSFHSKSREPFICRILTTLKQLLGSDYISEVLEVQQQENKYASFTKKHSLRLAAAAAASLLWLFFQL